MSIGLGFLSSSQLDFKLPAVNSSTSQQDVATVSFNSTRVDVLENQSYLNKNFNIDHIYLPRYFYKNISTYITQNHILKQS